MTTGVIAEPFSVTSAVDELLVGDTVELVEQNASIVDGTLEKKKALEEALDNAKTSVSAAAGSTKVPSVADEVKNLPLDDVDAANQKVEELKRSGKIKALEDNGSALDKIAKAVGIEKRLKEVSPDFKLTDFNNKLKMSMITDNDWSTTACDKSMAGLLSNLRTMFPDSLFADEVDERAKNAVRDASLLAAMRCGAKWLTDPAYEKTLEQYGKGMKDASDTFLANTLTDFKGEKHVRFATKVIDKMAEDGPAAVARLNRTAPKLIHELLRFYPSGFRDTYDEGDWAASYKAFSDALGKINPDWFYVGPKSDGIYNLELYNYASDEAAHILSYNSTHATNILLNGHYDRTGYSHRMVNGIILPET